MKSQQPSHSAPTIESSAFDSSLMSLGRPVSSIVNSSTAPSTTPSRLSYEVDYLKNRVRQLEERSSQVTAKAAAAPICPAVCITPLTTRRIPSRHWGDQAA
ncbi:hypothetical protein BDDG_11544 [Blastomyces dermatitidis ATCC 18188]|uniref:Uncharacterized protein n=1 Tax=Ajellomyces dermatitidis (strain ATCC 18188 / CBS 674.68) TaxID=653446 RepID=A0A0J9EJR9_AJEDA|nr:hypothetical protein BDDG_11544 [Blastomyces dermatitidis ATCC 18188]